MYDTECHLEKPKKQFRVVALPCLRLCQEDSSESQLVKGWNKSLNLQKDTKIT